MDARLDNRTYEEMFESIKKFEIIEEKIMTLFCNRYKASFGGEVKYTNYGFRQMGLERDINKTNALPDFFFSCTEGPFKGDTTVEVQAMKYDIPQFHIKKPKLHKTIETKSIFIQYSGLDTPNNRYAVITPGIMLDIQQRSKLLFGIVGYPGTICGDYPNGKPAYRVLDGWLDWNHEGNRFEKMVIN